MRRQSSSGGVRGGMKLMCSASTAAVVISLLGMGTVVESQGTSLWNPVRTICNLRFGRGTVIGDKMYVDGGEVMDQQNYLDGIDTPYRDSNVFRWQNEHLWTLDLSKKFNVSKPPWVAKEKPEDWNEHYNGAQGTMWNLGDGKFYTLGGWMSNIYVGPPGGHRIEDPYFTSTTNADTGTTTYYYELPATKIHSYDQASDNWTAIDLPEDIHRLSDIGYTQSKRNKVGYTLGGFPVAATASSTSKGFVAPLVDWVWQTTMSAYDFKKNTFNTSELPDEIGATNSVILHSLDRVGEEGVLLAIGGKSKNNNLEEYRPFDVVWVYDIATSNWMKQSATGDIPIVRTRTCSVVVPAPDLSSYQIYFFSGATTGDVRILDMYVLSVPSFVWMKIDLVNYPNEWPIGDTACGLYEDRQLIIVPGEVNVTTYANVNYTWYHECNLGTSVHVFDTATWEFVDEFDPDVKKSTVPPAISDYVGGDEKGNADLHQPKAGWDNKALGSIFSVQNALPEPDEEEEDDGSANSATTTSTDDKPTETGSSNDGENSGDPGVTEKPKSNTGAIAGGVVGGLAGLALIVGAFFFWRRRSNSPPPTAPHDPNVPELGANDYHGNQGYPPTQPPYYDTPYLNSNDPYVQPQELQAYEPQEMSGTGPGYYAPKLEHDQRGDMLDPPPSSLYPITPEMQQQQIQPLGVDEIERGAHPTEVKPVDYHDANAAGVTMPEPAAKAQ